MNKASAAKGAAWIMLFSLVSKVLFPIVGIIVTGRVGVEAVGVFGVVFTLHTVTELFRDGGLAVTYLADYKCEHGSEGLYHGLGITLGGIFAVASIVAAYPLAVFFEMPEMVVAMRWTAASMFVGSLASIPATRLVREAKFREAGLADVMGSGVGYGVALGMALAGYGLLSLLVQMLLRAMVYSGLVFYHTGWIRPDWAPRGFLRLFRVSLANLGSNLAYTIYTMADYAVIGKALGTAATGAYWVAFNLASKPTELITGPVARTMTVAFSREKDDPARQAHLLCRTLATIALFSVPAYVLLGAHASSIIALLYPERFSAAGPALSVLAIYLVFRSVGATAGSALVTSGRASWSAASWIPGYAIAAVGLTLFWDDGSLIEFVAVLTLGAAVVYSLNLGLAWHALRPSREDWRMMARALASTVPACLTMASCRVLPIAGWIQLVAAALLGAFVHMGTLGQIRLGDWRRAMVPAGWRDLYKTL